MCPLQCHDEPGPNSILPPITSLLRARSILEAVKQAVTVTRGVRATQYVGQFEFRSTNILVSRRESNPEPWD